MKSLDEIYDKIDRRINELTEVYLDMENQNKTIEGLISLQRRSELQELIKWIWE